MEDGHYGALTISCWGREYGYLILVLLFFSLLKTDEIYQKDFFLISFIVNINYFWITTKVKIFFSNNILCWNMNSPSNNFAAHQNNLQKLSNQQLNCTWIDSTFVWYIVFRISMFNKLYMNFNKYISRDSAMSNYMQHF